MTFRECRGLSCWRREACNIGANTPGEPPTRQSGRRVWAEKEAVEVIVDYQRLAVRLTDEWLAHILDHPEMVGLEAAISESLKHPALVVQSIGLGNL